MYVFVVFRTRSQYQVSAREDNLASTFIHGVSCNCLKSPKPGGLHHLSFLAEDSTFGPPKVQGSP